MPLNDPDHQESIPPIDGGFHRAPDDRFTPAPLSHTARAFLKRSLARNQRRRSVYHPRHLRVCIDGEERGQWDLGGGVCGPFSVPLSAAYLEIFGEDADGALLLAVFPLPEPELLEDDRVQHLWVTLEGGQAVAIEIALGEGPYGEVREYIIQSAYLA
jgi:hypothetical protein